MQANCLFYNNTMGIDVRERYLDPYTDFGFKKLFGTELNKDLLISFLNALFNDPKREIKDVQYLNPEHLGDGYGDRRAVFDVYCTTEDGTRFIVEMQKAEQECTFKHLFDQAEIAQFSQAERREYAESVKDYWDYYSTMKTAHKKGKAEGLAEGEAKGRAEGRAEAIKENARMMKAKGLSAEDIAEITGLTSEEIKLL